jgi:hypothetical protein
MGAVSCCQAGWTCIRFPFLSLSPLRISFSVIFSPFYFGTFIHYLGITMRRVPSGGIGIARSFWGMELREANEERRSGPPGILGLRENE